MILPLLLILIYLLEALALLVLQRWRLRRRYLWLVVVLPALLVWLLALIVPASAPATLILGTWEPTEIFHATPALQFDQPAWVYCVLVASLVLAATLTSAVREEFSASHALRSWSLSYLLGAFSLLSLLSGNLLTLIMLWLLLDLTELIVWISNAESGAEAEKIIINLSLQLAGGLLAAAAQGIFQPVSWQDFTQLPAAATLLVQAAAFFRLGIWPLTSEGPGESRLPSHLRLLTTLVPLSPTLLLIARTAGSLQAEFVSSTPVWTVFPLALLLSALISIGLWVGRAQMPLQTPVWVSGLSALTLLAAFWGWSQASLNWGLILIGIGGTLQLFTHRPKGLRWFGGLLALALTALPFTPAWAGLRLLDWTNPLSSSLLLLIQGLLLAGVVKHIQQEGGGSISERLASMVYALGLLLPTACLFWLAFPPMVAEWPSWVSSVVALAIPASAGGMLLWSRHPIRISRRPKKQQTAEGKAPSSPSPRLLIPYHFLFQVFWRLYLAFRWIASWTNRLLEGPAGLLWALLLTALLASLLSQSGLGQ